LIRVNYTKCNIFKLLQTELRELHPIGVTNCGTFNDFVNDRICYYSGCTSSQCPGGSQDLYCKGSSTIEILTQLTYSCIAQLAGMIVRKRKSIKRAH